MFVDLSLRVVERSDCGGLIDQIDFVFTRLLVTYPLCVYCKYVRLSINNEF